MSSVRRGVHANGCLGCRAPRRRVLGRSPWGPLLESRHISLSGFLSSGGVACADRSALKRRVLKVPETLVERARLCAVSRDVVILLQVEQAASLRLPRRSQFPARRSSLATETKQNDCNNLAFIQTPSFPLYRWPRSQSRDIHHPAHTLASPAVSRQASNTPSTPAHTPKTPADPRPCRRPPRTMRTPDCAETLASRRDLGLVAPSCRAGVTSRIRGPRRVPSHSASSAAGLESFWNSGAALPMAWGLLH